MLELSYRYKLQHNDSRNSWVQCIKRTKSLYVQFNIEYLSGSGALPGLMLDLGLFKIIWEFSFA